MRESEWSMVALVWCQRALIGLLVIACLVLHEMNASSRADAAKESYVSGWLEEQLDRKIAALEEGCRCGEKCECDNEPGP